MNKPPYVCSKCSRAFTRSWNAQRHIDSIHNGLSNISIKYKSGKTTNASKNQPGFSPPFAVVSKSDKFKYLHQKNANEPSFKSFYNGGSPMKKPNKKGLIIFQSDFQSYFPIQSRSHHNFSHLDNPADTLAQTMYEMNARLFCNMILFPFLM